MGSFLQQAEPVDSDKDTFLCQKISLCSEKHAHQAARRWKEFEGYSLTGCQIRVNLS